MVGWRRSVEWNKELKQKLRGVREMQDQLRLNAGA